MNRTFHHQNFDGADQQPWRAWARLVMAVSTLVAIWCLVLPRAARFGSIKAHIERLDAHQVDAGALYYTELDLLPEVLQRLEQAQREQPGAFWSPSP